MIEPGQPVEAGRWARLGAACVDHVLLLITTLLLIVLSEAAEHADAYATGSLVLLWRVLLAAVCAYLLLNGWLLFRRGQTIGKRLTGTVVVDANTYAMPQRATWQRQLARGPFFFLPYLTFMPFLPLSGLGIIVPVIDLAFIFGKERRTLHDRICGTRVIKRTATQHPPDSDPSDAP